MKLEFEREADGKKWVVSFRDSIKRRNELEKNGGDTAKLDRYIDNVLSELGFRWNYAADGWPMTEESAREKYLRHLNYAREHFNGSEDDFWFLE